jgi:hypothetical protein
LKITNYKWPKSSFLSVEKDLSIITDLILKNDRLKRLLYYNVPDALSQPNLDQKASIGLLGKNIKIVPKLSIDGTVLNYIIISFDNFTPTENPEFRDNIISFDILCHFDQWQLEEFELRPYKIAAELDSMLDKQKLTGIGTLNFLGANQLIINDEFAGLSLMYMAVHGEDDKKGMDVMILEVGKKTVLTDYFVIATGTSGTHVNALADEVEFKLKTDHKISPMSVQGKNE